MNRKVIAVIFILSVFLGCASQQGYYNVAKITQEYLNGTWYTVPKSEFTGGLFEEEFTWGTGLVGGNFFIQFDIDQDIFSQGDGMRFLDGIKKLKPGVFEVGLTIPINHRPSPEEIAESKARGPDEVIVVHFIDEDRIWIDLQKGFELCEGYDARSIIFYRYSGPGLSVTGKK